MTVKQPFILITRPQPDADETAAKLQKIGIRSFIEPMLTIKFREEAKAALARRLGDNVQAIIVTSANGVRALKNAEVPVKTHLIAIGPGTRTVALSMGYANVKAAGGNINELTRFIVEKYSPKDGIMIYASADVTAGELGRKLAANGFSLEEITVYESVATQRLTENCIKLLKNGSFDGVMFYSQRTAETFALLLEKEDCGNLLWASHAFCLSNNIATALQMTQFKEIHIAKIPDNESLLELIRDFKFTEN